MSMRSLHFQDAGEQGEMLDETEKEDEHGKKSSGSGRTAIEN